MPGNLFLSHSSADVEVARELRVSLEAAGYSCWMAPDDVDGTDSWAEQILTAIQACDAMLVLISGDANRSTHVSREVNIALGRKRPVFPIRIENVPPEASLEYLLSLVQRVDAFPPPITDHAPRILRRLDATLRKTARPASEPGAGTTESTQAAVTPPTEPLLETPAPAPLLASTPEPTTEPTAPPALPPPDPTAVAGTGVLPAGTRIGGFTIDGVLGEGGMATVYRATQEEPRRPVALKVIRADHAADPVYRKRFLAEKDTLAALEHPSIVPIYAAGEANGVLYIAMRLVDGPDLAGRIERLGKMTLAETVATLRPIADAVDYAHESGIVHRDLKPSNIILDRSNRPYLTDFGLGKQLDKSHGLSAPGIALGTLTYMAPEQFTGLTEPSLAGRVDIYALACVAYACLTGGPPFDGDTPERMMYAHVHETLPNRPGLSDSVETVLRRALAKNPADRFASAADFITTLAAAQAITERQTMPIPPPPRRGVGLGAWARTNTALAASIVTLVALTTVAAGVIISNPPGPSASTAAVASVAPSGATTSPASSPPSAPPTIPPTEPPPSDPPPTPTQDTRPTPTADNKAPTGIGLSIGGPATTSSKTVTLALKATGVTQMRLGRASSATGTCAYEGWRAYDPSVPNFDLMGGSGPGKRWVCAQFRDGSPNLNTAGPVRASVLYDHPPVPEPSWYYTWTAAELSGKTSLKMLFFEPPMVDDADGVATLTVKTLWWVKSDGTKVNYSTYLADDGRSATFPITSSYCNQGYRRYTFDYSVTDGYLTRNGTYYLDVCG